MNIVVTVDRVAVCLLDDQRVCFRIQLQNQKTTEGDKGVWSRRWENPLLAGALGTCVTHLRSRGCAIERATL